MLRLMLLSGTNIYGKNEVRPARAQGSQQIHNHFEFENVMPKRASSSRCCDVRSTIVDSQIVFAITSIDVDMRSYISSSRWIYVRRAGCSCVKRQNLPISLGKSL